MRRSEEKEQARLIRWSTLRATRAIAPQLEALFHPPNGGKRDAFTGAQLLALGVKKGVPDLLLPFPVHPHLGLAIEMKSADGVLSPHQKRWLAMLTTFGWSCQVARSAEEARDILAQYLQLPQLNEVPL